MKILFVHQNMPGQFKHLAPKLAQDPTNEVVFITKRADTNLPGVRRIVYKTTRLARATTHHYLQLYENSVLHGQAVLRACLALARDGWRPDVIVAHPGWGESLFLRDLFPRTGILSFSEFYYNGRGADIGFGSDDGADLDTICRARARNAHLLLSLESCDRGYSPTYWQRDSHPGDLRHKISVIFDGIDTGKVRPDAAARLRLSDDITLSREQEVVTFVARNLEPYRGFPSFMRAVPTILRQRPGVQIVIAGGDGVSYGKPAPDGKTWRQAMLAEIGEFDSTRVHFSGTLGYHDYLALLQVSSVHCYLTVPFVLSWSCMEALSAGCIVVASRTAPVQEVIEDGRNGFLVPFAEPGAIAARICDALRDRSSLGWMAARARQTVVESYDLARCLPQQVSLVRALA